MIDFGEKYSSLIDESIKRLFMVNPEDGKYYQGLSSNEFEIIASYPYESFHEKYLLSEEESCEVKVIREHKKKNRQLL